MRAVVETEKLTNLAMDMYTFCEDPACLLNLID